MSVARPAASARLAQVGLGQWGQNLARNFDDLAELVWLCDLDDERRAELAQRYPGTRVTKDVDDILADDSIEAVVIATPVPTHHELARRALEADKHVLVEKPPAMHGAEMEELCELAEERARVLMPGHLLLYHPGVRKLKEIVDSGDLGDVLCVYGNRQNLGTIRTQENALWSLGVHDLSVLLYLIDEEPSELWAHGNAFLNRGVEDVVFCYLRFPSGKIAHMHLSWLDPHKIRRITVVGRDRLSGNGHRRRLQAPRVRGRRKAAHAVAPLDGKARGASARGARARHGRLDRCDRVRRDEHRCPRDRGRPGVRARTRPGRR